MWWRLAILCVLVALTSGLAARVRACSCPERTLEEGIAEARAVFEGTVTDIASNGATPFGGLLVTLRVAKVWKGKPSDEVSVLTASNGAVCGFPFRAEERYLVYAFADTPDEMLRVSLCSLTKRTESARADLKRLGKPAQSFPNGTGPRTEDGRGCQTTRSLPGSDPTGFVVLLLALCWISRSRLRSSRRSVARAR